MDQNRPVAKCDVCASTDGLIFPNRNKIKDSDPNWLCAHHMVDLMEKKLDMASRFLAINQKEVAPIFPISTSDDKYKKPHPVAVPWSVAELAYSKYANKFGRSQSLERMAERGGFGPSEMDEYCPGWIEMTSEINILRNNLIDARADLVERDQQIFVLNSQLRVLGQTFDDLAAAVGWTKERCNQAGDSPMDVARELLRDAVDYKEKLSRANGELDVAIRKIAELSGGGL